MRPWDRVVVILMWMLFWACCAGAIFLIVAGMNGCAPARSPMTETAASRCEEDLYAQVMGSATCTEAQIKVDLLLRYSESCRALYGDAGLDVCAKVPRRNQDGGTDAARR